MAKSKCNYKKKIYKKKKINNKKKIKKNKKINKKKKIMIIQFLHYIIMTMKIKMAKKWIKIKLENKCM